MWLSSSSKSLIRRFQETRVYVTDIQYTRDDEPAGLFLFLTEYNTEIEVIISSILQKKRLRSREETLYHVNISTGHSLLLVLDHRRGNHYIYCKQQTYIQLLKQINGSDRIDHSQIGSPQKEVAASSESVTSLRGKIILIDSQILSQSPELLRHLVEQNDIILSPYYDTEIENYLTNVIERAAVISQVELLKQQYGDQITSDLYVDSHASRVMGMDLSDEHDYLLALASEQPVPKSQIALLTADDELTAKARSQGYLIFNPPSIPELPNQPSIPPQPLPTIQQPMPKIQTKTSIITNTEPQEDSAPTNLPPRSKKHRRKPHASLTNLTQLVRSFFYTIL